VVGTVSSEDKARLAREFGCEYVIVTKDYRFADAVKQHFGDGADVIVDGLGDAAREENFKALASCGHWISLGQVSGALQPIDPDLLVSKSATFSRPVAFAYVPTKASLAERAQRVWDGLGDGSIKRPPMERKHWHDCSTCLNIQEFAAITLGKKPPLVIDETAHPRPLQRASTPP